MTKFHDISRGFQKIPDPIFIYFCMVYIPFDSLTSLAGDRDMDLKSVEPWFGYLRKISSSNTLVKISRVEPSHTRTIHPLKSVPTITEILIFHVSSHFFHDIFHNFQNSMIWLKKLQSFFQGFPGAVGTLFGLSLSKDLYLVITQKLIFPDFSEIRRISCGFREIRNERPTTARNGKAYV